MPQILMRLQRFYWDSKDSNEILKILIRFQRFRRFWWDSRDSKDSGKIQKIPERFQRFRKDSIKMTRDSKTYFPLDPDYLYIVFPSCIAVLYRGISTYKSSFFLILSRVRNWFEGSRLWNVPFSRLFQTSSYLVLRVWIASFLFQLRCKKILKNIRNR